MLELLQLTVIIKIAHKLFLKLTIKYIVGEAIDPDDQVSSEDVQNNDDGNFSESFLTLAAGDEGI